MKNFNLLLVLIFMSGVVNATPIIHSSDFINDASRDHFNSFDDTKGAYLDVADVYIEDGIQVQQINGDKGKDIWTTFNPIGLDGDYGWYPNGGDHGYTAISLESGLDFGDVGFLIGSGFRPPSFVYYELWNDGSLLLAGKVAHQRAFHYLGFSGGGFDQILLRDAYDSAPHSVADGSFNALTIDAIEVAGISTYRNANFPEPQSIALMLLAFLGMRLVKNRSCVLAS